MISYVASKGAVIAMKLFAAREFGSDGIRVNCIAPGLTMSGGVMADNSCENALPAIVSRRCIKRHEEPEDLVGAVYFLLSADSDFVTG